MATVARLQLLQLHPHPKLLKPCFLSPRIKFKLPNFCFSSSSRSFSAFRCLSSNTDQIRQNSSHNEKDGSIVGDLLNYLNESWTQFHATAEAKRQLLAAGFHLLNENEEWELKPGGRYFFTRNMSSLVAFSIGENYNTGNGFHIIAAHTDSPCLKLKPISASSKPGYLMLNVQTYGGGLWHTWFDRDLSVAGRVIVRSDDGSFIQRLVKINRPLLRIPTLAIHLNRTVNQDGFKPNLETQLVPLLSTRCEEELPESKEQGPTKSSKAWHHPQLLEVLSEELDCCVDDIVGSDSIQGAGAPTMFQAMRRIVSCLAGENVGEGTVERAIRQSFLVSADMAHGVHPNFMDKHEENHRPQMQKGLVIKHNANQRYATSGVTAFLFKEVAKIHNLPTQEFVVRNDMGCGSTIGPILAAGVGIRTVDCGIPQLSMHSVREICGKEDVDTAYKLFKAFYKTFSSVDRKLSVDEFFH
ncbi:probable aspartyl aminopeptidase isoform X3 [Chenopodium quinoa]|uniref:probable aspartyl aminopeptidase isoform X3 n=1 Tax=Chenopodium quinoa TaxID=63459 RepID=UPI000B7750E3|nr:probable aspartyl aminopeptidase isoform X3 [Chenopodium quinoa]